MKLSDVLDQVQTGDLIAVSGRAWYAWAIRFWTLSRYSHVAVALWITFGGRERLCVFEALEGVGVRLVPLDRFLEERQRRGEPVDWFALDDVRVDRDKVAEYCFAIWHQRYSSWVQFAWSFGLLGGWLRRTLGLNPALNPARPFCSWVYASALFRAGYVARNGEAAHPALTSPEAVSRFTCLQRRGTLQC